MRVIAGELKGRRLEAVPGKQTRPTSDKVKEAVFQMMGPFFSGGRCLDLFAGSGSLGIEAISRGMDYTVFIDKQPQAIHTINKNIKAIGIEKQTEVSRMDAFRALRVTAKNNAKFDLILVDPPYKKVDYHKLLDEIMKHKLIKHGGLIYCEHEPGEDLPQDLDQLKIFKQVNYGHTISITIYLYHA
jgi:16S rRNA (guanine966-N2)-methyltransferase